MLLSCTLSDCLGTFRCGQMAATVHQLAETLGRAVDAKDKRLFEHSALTAELATVLALAHGLSHKQADVVHIAGHLHDIGKIGIPDEVLRKPGALDAHEWALIREHPVIGATILRPIELFGSKNGVAELVLTHHERFDGSGYPGGLSGLDIPLGGRILAIADSMAAMLENRVYHPAMTLDEVFEEVERCAGNRYDPHLCRDLLLHTREITDVVAPHARRWSGGEAWSAAGLLTGLGAA